MESFNVRLAATEDEKEFCYPVFAQLRENLSREKYRELVRAGASNPYHIAFAEKEGLIFGCAGFHLGENMAWGKFLYLDDLITVESRRSSGCGASLIAWLKTFASEQGCAQFHLDSGTFRKRAHAFYLRERFEISSFHFSMNV